MGKIMVCIAVLRIFKTTMPALNYTIYSVQVWKSNKRNLSQRTALVMGVLFISLFDLIGKAGRRQDSVSILRYAVAGQQALRQRLPPQSAAEESPTAAVDTLAGSSSRLSVWSRY